MKHNKSFLLAALSLLSISSLAACSAGSNEDEPFEEPVYQVGDTVIQWTSEKDSKVVPLGIPEGVSGKAEIDKSFGNEDNQSLYFEVKGSYVATNEIEKPYINHEHAKNGDVISMYLYVPSDSNIDTLQMELLHGNNNAIAADSIKISENNTQKWFRTVAVFDTLDILTAIRLNFKPIDSSKPVQFYADDLNITYGEETQKTGYEFKDESLKEAFDGYLTIGNIMSSNMYNNTKMRQILKDNFNSITAENEAKPEAVLDQAACQELAKSDETAVAISTSRFEKIYDWAEAHHIPVRHHTFVWHQQTPGWFFNKGYQNNGQQVTREVMVARLNNYLETMIETLDDRWPGLVYALDIVNEAIEEVGQQRRGNWLNTVGEDYIYQAFLAANKYKKDYQELYYNDYAFDQEEWGGVERCQWAVDELLKKAIDEKLIDGIGIQSHIEKPEYADAVIEDAKIICKAGIKCQLTELDININSNSESEFARQKDLYKKVVKSVLEGNRDGTMDVNAIIVWGVTDDTSWHRSNYPLMFDSNYAKKPSYYGFMEAMEEFLRE